MEPAGDHRDHRLGRTLFSSRLHRFRRYIPAATVWTHAQGVLIEAQQDGTVA